jgi:hypothetical protein
MVEPFEIDEQKLLEILGKRILSDGFQVSLCNEMLSEKVKESYENLTVQEIMNKIKDFLAQEPSKVNYEIFLKFLSYYPVSMCKREVSPLLRKLIGGCYRLGRHEPDEESNLDWKISYEDLAEIFCRSKATISDCIVKTEDEWKRVKQEVDQAMEREKYAITEAKRQIIEEAKQKLTENNIEGINV